MNFQLKEEATYLHYNTRLADYKGSPFVIGTTLRARSDRRQTEYVETDFSKEDLEFIEELIT